MASVDYAARLAQVQAAISAILTGGHQSYTVDGRSVTKLDLPQLQREESRLIGKMNRAARGGAFSRGDPV